MKGSDYGDDIISAPTDLTPQSTAAAEAKQVGNEDAGDRRPFEKRLQTGTDGSRVDYRPESAFSGEVSGAKEWSTGCRRCGRPLPASASVERGLSGNARSDSKSTESDSGFENNGYVNELEMQQVCFSVAVFQK